MKMAFTQKERLNINQKQVRAYVSPGDRCDGCDFKCALGYTYSIYRYHIYPTINGKKVSYYINENYESEFAGIVFLETRRNQLELYAKTRAGEIARLCDYYKTR